MATTSPFREPSRKEYDHNDPSLKTGTGGLTVWDLKKMAQDKRFSELEELFNNGLSMNALPVGMSAGSGIGLVAGDNKLIAEWVDSLAEKNWRGKIYFSSNDKRVSEGRNRFRKSFLLPHSSFVPMLKFKTMVLDSHPLAPRAKSNLVVLLYADPLTKPYVQELLVTKIQGFDAMVAVKGKYGPVFVGKTWLGKYDKKTGEFTASDPNNLAGWYFLDFNEGALKEQKESHWDGSEEEILDPLPHIEN
jgi:hypothetical protein